jgi:uncharacterized OsmC-like protein
MRNHDLLVGQPASFDTHDEAPSALELLLAAVGAALTTGLQWRLSRLGVQVANLEVVVKGKLADSLVFLGVAQDGNPGLAGLDVAVYLDASQPDDGPEVDFANALRTTVARCPVTQSLCRGLPLQTHLRTT